MTMHTTASEMRAEMRARRKAARLTQAQLAVLVGVARVTLGKWERGNSSPTWEQWDRWLAGVARTPYDCPTCRHVGQHYDSHPPCRQCHADGYRERGGWEQALTPPVEEMPLDAEAEP